MIEYRDVTVRYPHARLFHGLDLVVDQGATSVLGPSGSGKSTLLRLAAGIQSPDAGTVEIDGVAVEPVSWRSAGDSRVAVIHQDYRLVPFLSTAENLLLAAELREVPVGSERIEEVLDAVHLGPEFAARYPATMSGGEQQRVAIARALMTGSAVLLADEPTGALDAGNTRRVAEILAGLGESAGMTVVVATHDPIVAAAMTACIDLGVLRGGDLVGA